MSENEWIDLSDNMEKTDGYVKRDAQAMKDRPGEEYILLSLFFSVSPQYPLSLSIHPYHYFPLPVIFHHHFSQSEKQTR